MAAEIVNASSPELTLPKIWPFNTSQLHGALPRFVAGWSTWQYVVSFLVGVVVYDQGNQEY